MHHQYWPNPGKQKPGDGVCHVVIVEILPQRAPHLALSLSVCTETYLREYLAHSAATDFCETLAESLSFSVS